MNMNLLQPELASLRAAVEKKYGRGIHTSTDFESLSVIIEQTTREFVSASTLKRIWGYVSSHPVPRIATLDVLARYVGDRDFGAFRKALMLSPSESAFFTTRYITAESLSPGDRLVIGWNPNRQASLEYLGEARFRVLESENASLKPGDEFCTSQFLLGQPLFLGRIRRGETETPSYVAGKKEGLTRLEIFQKDR